MVIESYINWWFVFTLKIGGVIFKNHVFREKHINYHTLWLELNQDIRIKPPIRVTHGDIYNETSLSLPFNMDRELRGFDSCGHGRGSGQVLSIWITKPALSLSTDILKMVGEPISALAPTEVLERPRPAQNSRAIWILETSDHPCPQDIKVDWHRSSHSVIQCYWISHAKTPEHTSLHPSCPGFEVTKKMGNPW